MELEYRACVLPVLVSPDSGVNVSAGIAGRASNGAFLNDTTKIIGAVWKSNPVLDRIVPLRDGVESRHFRVGLPVQV